MDVSYFGRMLLVVGLVVAAIGGAIVLGGRLGLGRLPGDLSFRIGGVRIFAPLATSLLLSLVATIVLTVLLRR